MKILPAFLALLLSLSVFSQTTRLSYPDLFAPSSPLVHPVEASCRQSICLNGSWQFQPIPLPDGFREGIDPTPALPPATDDNWDKTSIRIPSPWNVNSFADNKGEGGDFRCYPSYPRSWEKIKMGWLQKSFTIPDGWKGKRILLHFDAVAGDADIRINGQPAGHHFGIFLPFDIDVTDQVKFGSSNELRIGIRKPSLFDKRGNYGRRPYQAGSFWGQHIAGIWQDVTLIALAPVRISSVYIQPRLTTDQLEIQAALTNDENSTQQITLSGDIRQWIGKDRSSSPRPSTELATNPALIIKPITITVPPHSTITQTLTIPVGHRLQQWSPDTPSLYGLVLRTGQKGQPASDIKYERFGWRQTSIANGQFLLNGRPFILKGDSWHFLGIPQMTRRYAWAWYTALHDAHLNAVRLHAEPYPAFYLDMADEMGILVLDETAVWASDGGPKLNDPAFWKDSQQQLEEQILRDRNHPSVFGWSVSNEVKPVIRNVLHGPASMMDTLLQYFTDWAATCRRLDPSRPWISADGEDDGEGRLPVYIVHYGGNETMDRARHSGKPWGVGEAGMAYYGTPQQVAETNGSKAYASFEGRMEGVAASSWSSLMEQRKRDAVYRSVFNLVWYGLQPLALGMKDTTNAPGPDDGVFFPSFIEGQPGVQPERLGPYCTTLNPGYDPALPLYRTWPLFDAIRNAATDGPILQIDATDSTIPAKTIIDETLSKCGTVLIWNITAEKLDALNKLMPSPITLTNRTASSLEIVTSDPVTRNLTAADLYFSEQNPPAILHNGLDGPLIRQGQVLLQAAKTDWLRWNRQPEYAKTAMVIRSERETSPSGAALVRISTGGGQLLLTTLPSHSPLEKIQRLIRQLQRNIGDSTATGNGTGAILRSDGQLTPDMSRIGKPDAKGETWLSFWISSPRTLDDLLSEPDIPVLKMEYSSNVTAILLNDKMLPENKDHIATPLRLQRGWNHFRIRLKRSGDSWPFEARLSSSKPEFLNQLEAAMEKP